MLMPVGGGAVDIVAAAKWQMMIGADAMASPRVSV
jgi:hypothetical protein